jgi:ISMca3 transposase
MKKKTALPEYTSEVRERAIRLLEEVRVQHPSDCAAIQAIAPKIGCNPETLRAWYRKHQDAKNPLS